MKLPLRTRIYRISLLKNNVSTKSKILLDQYKTDTAQAVSKILSLYENINQSIIAESIGISFSMLSKIKYGEKQMTVPQALVFDSTVGPELINWINRKRTPQEEIDASPDNIYKLLGLINMNAGALSMIITNAVYNKRYNIDDDYKIQPILAELKASLSAIEKILLMGIRVD